MAKKIDDFLARLNTLIQDPAGQLDDADRRVLVTKAIVQRYSKDRPLEKVVEVTGNDKHDIDAPAAYVDGFSILKKVEYPIGEIPPTYLDDDDYTIYRTPSGLKLRIISTQPTSTEKLWVTVTAPHLGDGSTVPESDFEAVCDCIAAMALEILATKYAGTVDPTIQADVVNYRTRSQEYLSLAKAAWARYFNALGIQAGGGDQGSAGQSAAVAVGEMEASLSFGGDRLTHQRRR